VQRYYEEEQFAANETPLFFGPKYSGRVDLHAYVYTLKWALLLYLWVDFGQEP
jgi:hypothetical protein